MDETFEDEMTEVEKSGASAWLSMSQQHRIKVSRDYLHNHLLCNGGILGIYIFLQSMLVKGGSQFCQPHRIATVLLYGIFASRLHVWEKKGWTIDMVSCSMKIHLDRNAKMMISYL